MSKKKQKIFTVYFLTPYCTYEGIIAKDEDDAIRKCEIPAEFDLNEPSNFLAIEEDDNE